ncbi:MAG: hypothetical protein AB2A00_31160 [Myxococcota bacterium]
MSGTTTPPELLEELEEDELVELEDDELLELADEEVWELEELVTSAELLVPLAPEEVLPDELLADDVTLPDEVPEFPLEEVPCAEDVVPWAEEVLLSLAEPVDDDVEEPDV